jgi:endonuclease/exonuclease/phosphatase (EEP) superfamily protein YafD
MHLKSTEDTGMDEKPTSRARLLLRVIWNLILAAVMLYGVVTISYLLARVMIGERWNPVAFANNFVPWWALGGLAASLIALLSCHRRWLIALQVPILAAFAILYGDLLWPRGDRAQADTGFTFTAANYNMFSFHSDPNEVIRTIEALDADIIGFEEVSTAHFAAITEHFAEEYPYYTVSPSDTSFGVGLLSRYRIIDQEVKFPPQPARRFMQTVLDINGVAVTVIVAHPNPPVNFFSPLSYDDSLRSDQLGVLRDFLRQESGPVLVLCDCNMTDQSDDYRAMDDLLDDSFREAGQRMGFTFPARVGLTKRFLPSLVRIDYIWHSDHFVALDAHVEQDSGTSDHRPVRATLKLRNQK